MKFSDPVRPLDRGVHRILFISLAIIVLAVGASIFAATYFLASADMPVTVYGLVLVWAGSIVFFYSVITEEHTMKELFLRQSYFFTGLLVMILGIMFISLSGMYANVSTISTVEFGLFLLICGAGLIIMSAQRSYDYSKQNGLIAIGAGALLTMGGLLAETQNVTFAGIFIMIFAAIWLGLRDRYAQ
jgi:hypothetical protein